MCVVYIISPEGSNRSYVGATVDLGQRLRKHNKEIKGGAKRTRKHENWRVICYVSGFSTWVEALRFEWALQHPKKTKMYREAIARAVEQTHRVGPRGCLKRRLVEVEAMMGLRPDLRIIYDNCRTV